MATHRTRSSDKESTELNEPGIKSRQVVVKDVDMVQNVNNENNNSKRTQSKWKTTSQGNKGKGLKKAKIKNSVESDHETEDVSENDFEEQFVEDGDIVKMNVNADDDEFGSKEGEVNDSEMDEEDHSEMEETEDEYEESSAYEDEEQNPVHSPRHKKKRKSWKRMEEKIDNLSNALMDMQNIMVQNGILRNKNDQGAAETDKSKVKTSHKTGKGDEIIEACVPSVKNTNSETTVYENAVPEAAPSTIEVEDGEVILNLKRGKQGNNPSSDEQADTSDELINVTDQFIADCAAEAERRRSLDSKQGWRVDDGEDPIAEAEQRIKAAEASKIRIVATPGNELNVNNLTVDQEPQGLIQNVSAMVRSVDDNYQMIGAHIDLGIRQKIFRHEYIDFARLLTHDRITKEEDHRMEIVNKGGFTYFVPVSDREVASTVNCFGCWEQAFRVFSNIYTKFFPNRATELIQYNHVIFTVSQSFIWDNVYLYDKEFRMHLSNFPGRSWAVILQQAWSICLRDRIRRSDEGLSGGSYSSKKKKGEHCRRFNKGKCTAGASCRYDHRCDVCGKWGHGAHICRNKTGSSPASVNKNNQSSVQHNSTQNMTNSSSARTNWYRLQQQKFV